MNNILGMIGLAKKAGYLSSGTYMCETSIKSGISKLVIIAEDASSNTKKSITDSCIYRKVPCIEFSDMYNLGKFSGGGEKAVLSVNDEKFADALLQKIKCIYGKDR